MMSNLENVVRLPNSVYGFQLHDTRDPCTLAQETSKAVGAYETHRLSTVVFMAGQYPYPIEAPPFENDGASLTNWQTSATYQQPAYQRSTSHQVSPSS